MITDFTPDLFLPRVGELFRVIVDDTHELRTQLTEVAEIGVVGVKGRQQFSLVFHAPHGALVPQQIYRIENANMEDFDCFLVPIGPDAQGMRFEAIFT